MPTAPAALRREGAARGVNARGQQATLPLGEPLLEDPIRIRGNIQNGGDAIVEEGLGGVRYDLRLLLGGELKHHGRAQMNMSVDQPRNGEFAGAVHDLRARGGQQIRADMGETPIRDADVDAGARGGAGAVYQCDIHNEEHIGLRQPRTGTTCHPEGQQQREPDNCFFHGRSPKRASLTSNFCHNSMGNVEIPPAGAAPRLVAGTTASCGQAGKQTG